MSTFVKGGGGAGEKVTIDGVKVSKKLALNTYKGSNPLEVGRDGGIIPVNTLLLSDLELLNGAPEVTIDGVEVEEELALVSVATDIRRSRLPYVINGGCAVVYRGEIHVLSPGSSGSTTHIKFDGTSWVEVSTLPYACYNGCAVVYEDCIHIIGGNSSSHYKYHYKWDGSAWTNLGEGPSRFNTACAVVYDGAIHLLGGGGDSTTYNRDHYMWDGSAWTELTTYGSTATKRGLPQEFYNGCAVVYEGCIHILGGTSYGNQHYKFDGTSWVEVGSLPIPLISGVAVVYEGCIHILDKVGSSFGTGEVYGAHYKWDGTSWSEENELPDFVDNVAGVVHNGNIHILGVGDNADHYELSVNVYRKAV